jgi:hypothetical protein
MPATKKSVDQCFDHLALPTALYPGLIAITNNLDSDSVEKVLGGYEAEQFADRSRWKCFQIRGLLMNLEKEWA